ncbi:phenylalanyl-tRNA synthetase beta subunit [Nitrosomonas sp. PY1]|uniref:phenylalanine--tRNA ligase subunit beta n=1 Tax=Nitrosomonas sp. PY1 TaxID=1803906 RepID=UPI001FC8402F|nr:phenylalanine--tRNA ligase subunit beta [Nitrosomonas sp. PY1]GKS69373.1 phenylalanyl-tRNA synthetase beta subunit [Nitrosomonas sp. PY1]
MKFSENWLRTFVNPSLSSERLAHVLTMAGIEVESVESVAATFNKVVVAEVCSVKSHPSADRLKVCQVKANQQADLLQIVCGAPNVSEGMRVPCALIGANLPGIQIKSAKLRGIESEGMLCSAKELGLAEIADGLLVLPEDAPVGKDFRSYFSLDDRIFTLSLTPNRADCLSVLGVAREVAAITASELIPLESPATLVDIQDVLDVHIMAPEACPLYCGRVIKGIDINARIPLWMTQRLERSGIRSINPIVDITNYILLETGQPLHSFDLNKINGSIQVRYAKSGEKITLLNDNIVNLTPDMLIIADESKPLALAGIMGGLDSSVTDGTVDIFLESAFFMPSIISGKSFQLGFISDSAYRFERGVDFAATHDFIDRASYLIQTICGGQAGPIVEKRYQLPARSPIQVRRTRIQRILGIELDVQQIKTYFQRLKFKFLEIDGSFTVTPPSYRFDLTIEEDLIEELARIYGYDRIPAHYPQARMAMLPAIENIRPVEQIKQSLVNRDYQEVINYAFVDANWELDFAGNDTPIKLVNPLASQMGVMRSTLVGGLIANLQFNLNRKQSRVRIFEIGRCFIRSTEIDCVQIEKLAGLIYGDIVPEQWGIPARSADFYDIKGDIENLCGNSAILFKKISHPALHPGKSAQIIIADNSIGWLGELHPKWQKKFDLQKNTVLFEINLEHLLPQAIHVTKEISKFPPVQRDIAIIVDNDINVQTLLSCMNEEKSPTVIDIALFDIYRGKGMENNKKSLAFRILLQDTEKTLTDIEVDSEVLKLIKILENRFCATLRNG